MGWAWYGTGHDGIDTTQRFLLLYQNTCVDHIKFGFPLYVMHVSLRVNLLSANSPTAGMMKTKTRDAADLRRRAPHAASAQPHSIIFRAAKHDRKPRQYNTSPHILHTHQTPPISSPRSPSPQCFSSGAQTPQHSNPALQVAAPHCPATPPDIGVEFQF